MRIVLVSEAMKERAHFWSAAVFTGLISQVSALEIIFRYDLDTENFFDQADAREALEVAASFYENLIVDELEAIDPNNFSGGTQQSWVPLYLEPDITSGNNSREISTAVDLVVPENTIIIFAGGRNLATFGQGGPGGAQARSGNTAWFNQIFNRGEPGAITFNGGFSTENTDTGPWGGSIFFDTDRAWNFSTTDPAANSGIDFLSAALHEIGHVLGIGHAIPQSSWSTHTSGSQFEGLLATSSNNGTNPPLDLNLTHWSNSTPNSRTLALFGRQHGDLQRPLMQSTLTPASTAQFTVPTDLDIAALRDIGWELADTPTPFKVTLNLDSATPSIDIPTVTGTHYQVHHSSALETFAPIGPEIIGDGTIQNWPDTTTSAARAFYRVEACLAPSGETQNVKSSPQATARISAPSEELDLPAIPPTACSCGK